MSVSPVVRNMVMCDNWEFDANNSKRVNILGLMNNIRSMEIPPFPLLHRGFCVFMVLTECRGEGVGQIIGLFEETHEVVIRTPKYRITFGNDPLEVVAIPFRIRDINFSKPGIYSIQFWYNNVMLVEQTLRLR